VGVGVVREVVGCRRHLYFLGGMLGSGVIGVGVWWDGTFSSLVVCFRHLCFLGGMLGSGVIGMGVWWGSAFPSLVLFHGCWDCIAHAAFGSVGGTGVRGCGGTFVRSLVMFVHCSMT
jgi:hypothetical protein